MNPSLVATKTPNTVNDVAPDAQFVDYIST